MSTSATQTTQNLPSNSPGSAGNTAQSPLASLPSMPSVETVNQDTTSQTQSSQIDISTASADDIQEYLAENPDKEEELKNEIKNNEQVQALVSQVEGLYEEGLITLDVKERFIAKVSSPGSFDKALPDCWISVSEATETIKKIREFANSLVEKSGGSELTQEIKDEVAARVLITFSYGGAAAIRGLEEGYSTLIDVTDLDAAPDDLWDTYKTSILAISELSPEALYPNNIEEQERLKRIQGLLGSEEYFRDNIATERKNRSALEASFSDLYTPLKDSNGTSISSLSGLFQNGSESIVAIAIGNAEGTRTPLGDKTENYYGHSDPGNKVWNQGSFSYQHGAESPEAADQRWLAHLSSETTRVVEDARSYGIEQLTLQELLSALDLLTQAPKCVFGEGGYLYYLAKAKERGLTGDEAILEARVNSFKDPETGLFDAPGLEAAGVTVRDDQTRRMLEINKALQTQGYL